MAPIAQDPPATIRPGRTDEEPGYLTPNNGRKMPYYENSGGIGNNGGSTNNNRSAPVSPGAVVNSVSSSLSTPIASGKKPSATYSRGGGINGASMSPPISPLDEALDDLVNSGSNKIKMKNKNGSIDQIGDPNDPHSLQSLESGDLTEREVPYASGATDLFRAAEECRWDDAVKICRERPEQARIWVKSSGNEQTSFDWNVWKRLPIHEACRRQPPPILLSTLLDAFPASSSARTHFGELPLHLAVGCGSNPESIHLLIASFPGAATKLDDAGRSPVDLVHEGVQPEDRAVILGSLERCLESQREQQTEWSNKYEDMIRRHAAEIDRLARENRKRLAVKDMALAELAREVQAGAERLDAASAEADEREAEIQRRSRAERALAEQARTSEEEVSRLRQANRDLKKKLSDYDSTVLKHEVTIERLNGRVNSLSNDLRAVCSMQDDLIQNDVHRVEQEMVKLIRTQKSFLNRVRDRGDAIHTILAESDVDLPVSSTGGSGGGGGGGNRNRTPSSVISASTVVPWTASDDVFSGNGNVGDDESEAFSTPSSHHLGSNSNQQQQQQQQQQQGTSATKSPYRKKNDPSAAASRFSPSEGAAERAAAMATVHLKKEMLLDGDDDDSTNANEKQQQRDEQHEKKQ